MLARQFYGLGGVPNNEGWRVLLLIGMRGDNMRPSKAVRMLAVASMSDRGFGKPPAGFGEPHQRAHLALIGRQTMLGCSP